MEILMKCGSKHSLAVDYAPMDNPSTTYEESKAFCTGLGVSVGIHLEHIELI